MRGCDRLWAAYVALLAAFALLTWVIPTPVTAVSIAALFGTAGLFLLAAVAAAIRFRRDGRAGVRSGWPGIFTLLVVQLFAYAFLYGASVFCSLTAAIVVEAALWLLAAAVLAGEDRLRRFGHWIVRRRKAVIRTAAAAVAAILILWAAIPLVRYQWAAAQLRQGRYEAAAQAFGRLNGYWDSDAQMRESRYRLGRQLAEAGEYEEAFGVLCDMEEYADVRAYIDGSDELSAFREKFAPYDVGNTVEMGSWNETALTWRVLDREENRRLLLCDQLVAQAPYHAELAIVSWETCDLRAWLNGPFAEGAFSAAESARIVETALANDDNAEYRTDGGNDTVDRVFLLSLADVQAIYENHLPWLRADTSWWLRSPGCSRVDAVTVYDSGGINGIGTNVNWDRGGVRPAIWIDLTK